MNQKSAIFSRQFIVPAMLLVSLSSCLNSQKIDDYIAMQYDDQIPAVKKQSAINVRSEMPATGSKISVTNYKMTKMLPLLFYWQIKDRFDTKLNPGIAVNNFVNAMNGAAGKSLQQKLNGQKLELSVEHLPVEFSYRSQTDMIWIIYLISWAKVWIEPEKTDITINYTFYPSNGDAKTGKISVKNPMNTQNLRLFQSWRSGISEYIVEYNQAATLIAKSIVAKLLEEI